MRILQLVVEGAGFYERKCQAIDVASLPSHFVTTWQWHAGTFSRDGVEMNRREFLRETDAADLVHVYSAAEFPAAAVKRLRIPYVARGNPAKSRVPWMSLPEPAVRPDMEELPEPVGDEYRAAGLRAPVAEEPRRFVIGTYGPARRDVRRMCEAAIARIARFRDDVDWDLYDEPPPAATMKGIDAWVDPTTDPDDLDGMVAEAQSVGIITIASRTPVNERRLVGGSAGYLVPPGDANELAHALANALFRPELTLAKLSAVRAREWYAPERRASHLVALYERTVHGSHR